MNRKIVLIGQAPPVQAQEIPYDTTMLYTWLAEIGITIDMAQDLFVFTAISGTLRGVKNGAHMLPLKKDMELQYGMVIKPLLAKHTKVILLGGVAQKFMATKVHPANKFLNLLHPSKRNYHKFTLDKENILATLKEFINGKS